MSAAHARECVVCGEPVLEASGFFTGVRGVSHEACAMHGRHDAHRERVVIKLDLTPVPTCPACFDGLDNEGERCGKCGGTARRVEANPFVENLETGSSHAKHDE